ncbi:inactive glucose-1-phosphate adenylyltransferase small subunit 2, chloroplastic, partial [Olea europaea subsp. europaea]
VAAIVFDDGSHSQLYPLTKGRAESAIPISRNYRLIDAVVSNCINSNITKIYALTQFNSTSLNSHLSRAYAGARLGKEGFVEVIAAYQSPEDQDWFQICAYQFDGFWEDMRSIGAYYQANMESTRKTKDAYSFYDKDSPVYTLPRNLPPTPIIDALITYSVIGDGCILSERSRIPI